MVNKLPIDKWFKQLLDDTKESTEEYEELMASIGDIDDPTLRAIMMIPSIINHELVLFRATMIKLTQLQIHQSQAILDLLTTIEQKERHQNG